VLVLVLLFIAVPLIEIAVIIQVGSWIGVVETIVLLVSVSIFGAWLVKRQGIGVLRRIMSERDEGKVPGAALFDAALILVAGVLLLTPGFVTDVVGLLLLVPPVRAGIRAFLRRRWTKRVDQGRKYLDL